MGKIIFNTKFAFDLRSAQFGLESKFVVATGGPISGKTSVLNALKVPYEPEVARVFIESEIARGLAKEEIRADEAAFQRALVDTKIAIELSRPKDRTWYFDRAMPDSITYYRAAGLDPSSILEACKLVKYALVFHFELLPFNAVELVLAQDPVRTEDMETRQLLDQYLEKDYRALGYDVIRVPVMSVNDRVIFVIEELKRRGVADISNIGHSARGNKV